MRGALLVISILNFASSGNAQGQGFLDSYLNKRPLFDANAKSSSPTTAPSPQAAPSPTAPTAPPSIEECVDLKVASGDACKPPEHISQGIAMISMMMQGGDIRNACKKTALLYGVTAGEEFRFSQVCGSAARSCIGACADVVTKYEEEIRTCAPPKDCAGLTITLSRLKRLVNSCKDDNNTSLKNLIRSGANSVFAGLNVKCAMKAGKDVAAPKVACMTMEEQKTNPSCQYFCFYNEKHPGCGCDHPNRAETLHCKCKLAEYKSTIACKPPSTNVDIPPPPDDGFVTNPPPSTINNEVLGGVEEDILDDSEQEFEPGAGGEGQKAATDFRDQGGGGVSALGGGPGGNGPGGGGGGGPGPYNTDIDKGYTNGQGGGGGGGSGGGYAAAAVQAQGGGYGDEKPNGDKFDWKSLLPKDGKNRAPAGVDAELYNNGITAANGLTNFEKVTRKMNEKRPTLLP